MFPISTPTVKFVIQYISPLTEALPPHLISSPLRQRHHYLQISPVNAIEYLCWPSPNSARAVELLDQCMNASNEDQTSSYPTRYTSDAESTFAHVQIFCKEEGLRIVFQWDAIGGWTYHDLQLMPFPASSFPTIQEAVSSNSAAEAELERLPVSDFAAGADYDNNIDEDSYWDAYGAAADTLSSPLPPRSAAASDSIQGEDAYWAQLRIPMIMTQDLPFPSEDNPITIPVSTIHSRPTTSKIGPPSPSTLAHLLNSSEFSPSPDLTVADSDLLTPPSSNGDHVAMVVSPLAGSLSGVPLSNSGPHTVIDDEENRALMDSIKGLYYLWKVGKRKEGDEKGSDAFLRIVQAAVSHE
ncbi:hypothetical protein BU15DRAFT_60976 [Melanogaster broomeanus]|nr:hypothetical protein BU15DRAFT_60976 [Melanogaster broomeanus]